MAKVYTEAYGCSANLSDFEIALGLLLKEGFELSGLEDSDLNIIFTCVVKQPTFNKMIHRIKELTRVDKPLIVAGCAAKTDSKLIEKINPKASLLAPDNVERIAEVSKAAIDGKKIVLVGDIKRPKLKLPRCRKNPFIGIVQIARGCISNCSYCYEPYRGKLFSYPSDEIVQEVKNSLKGGCREIWLTSLDNGCYGFDFGKNLASLLNEICKIKEKFFVRVGMMNPKHAKLILDELVEAYKDEKIFKFLHLPVQSGSDRILELMKRGYTTEDFLGIVERFKKEIPDITLSTDIIVGFPSETDDDFKDTLKLIEKIEPSIINISKFGARPCTEAAMMKQLDTKTINKRSLLFSKLVKKICLEGNKKWVGWKGEILVDEIGKGKSFIGRNFAYKPIVLRTEEKIFGKFLEVEIGDAKENFLIAKILNKSLL
jgi:MiaB-like tRNA modifying enzyme